MTFSWKAGESYLATGKVKKITKKHEERRSLCVSFVFFVTPTYKIRENVTSKLRLSYIGGDKGVDFENY